MAHDKPIAFEYSDLGWISSVDEFIQSLFKLRREIKNEKLWYRGQPDSKDKLLPTIGRLHEYGGRSKTFSIDDEREILHRFRRRAYAYDGGLVKAGEALFLARHYGLPTRLLDWTANALFGIYFATVEKPTCNGSIWTIRRVRGKKDLDAFKLAKISSEEKVFKLYGVDDKPKRRGGLTADGVKIVHPFYNSPRIVAQDGAFTFHSNPRRPLESYNGVYFQPDNLDILTLYRWRIRAKRKPEIVAQLSGLGITHRIVFPDLDGIARSIWETEVLWRGKPKSG